MKPEWIIVSILAGYLIGSISFARIIAHFFLPEKKIKEFKQPIPGTDEFFESDLISATTVAVSTDKKFGCLISILDMLKAGIPALILKLVFKEDPYYILYAIFCITGHNYPVYYRFVGGRGESSIIGSSIVINLPALALSHLSAIPAAFLTGSVLVMRWGGMVLMAVWVWILSHDWWQVAFAISSMALFFLSMIKDLGKFAEFKRRYSKPPEEMVSEFIMMGKSSGRMLDKYGLPQLIKRWRRKKGPDS